ncbi:unnamed protein product [Polarella glacialis]|uniref:Uncharacterized protein n=1 Tax=Polarella glacialis TaxID=89957 RepID=A0A813JL39_POLGL|nr:unnamed protein product [Polarella glacialis]
MHFTIVRGGEQEGAIFASSLRTMPGELQMVRQHAFRVTFDNPMSRESGLRDARIDLRALGLWGPVVVFLGKTDFSPLLLARVLSVEPSHDGCGEVARYRALREWPDEHLVGSMGLFSRLQAQNFDHAQHVAIASLADPRGPCLRQALRFCAATSMCILDFLWALAFVLPHWVGFDYKGKSLFEHTASETHVAWSNLLEDDAWASAWYFSYPPSARTLFDIAPFAHSFNGSSKRCIQASIEGLQTTDRSFSASSLPACQSDFQKNEMALPPLTEARLQALPLTIFVEFFQEAATWVRECTRLLVFDNKIGPPRRVDNFGHPAWSYRVQTILVEHASRGLLAEWGLVQSSLGRGAGTPNMATSLVNLHGVASATPPSCKEAKKLEKEIRALQGEGSDDEDSGGYGGKGKGKSKGYGKGKGKRSRYEEAEEDDGWPEDDQESRLNFGATSPAQCSWQGQAHPGWQGSQMPKGVFRSESESYICGGICVHLDPFFQEYLAQQQLHLPHFKIRIVKADADSAEDEQKPSKAESWAAATSAEAAELGSGEAFQLSSRASIIPEPNVSAPSEPNMARRRSQKNPKSAKIQNALLAYIAGQEHCLQCNGDQRVSKKIIQHRHGGASAQPTFQLSSDAQPSAKTQAKEPAVTEGKEIDIPPEEPAVPEVKAKEPAGLFLYSKKVARKLAFWAGLDPKVCQRPKAGHGGITRYAQWLSEMKLQATSARYHQQAELDVTREAIVAHSGELTEFKRHSTTVVQQLQAQVSELKRMMSEMVAEMRVLGRQHAEIHASYLREDSERGPSKSLGASGAPEVADLHGAIQASQEHTLSKFGEVDHAMSILHANHSVVHKELLDTKKDWTRGQDLLGQAIQTLSQDFADFQKHSTNVTNKVQSDMYHVEERSRDERDRLNKAEVQIAAIHQTVQASANELVLLRSEQVEGMPATSLVSRHPSPCNARHDATLVASGSGAFLSPLLQQASQNSQQQQSAQLQQQKLQYEQQLQQKLINQQLIRPVRSPAPAGSRGW